MPKQLSQKIVTVLFLVTLGLSACQSVTPDAVTTEKTMLAAVAQTLTSAPTLTPLPTSTSTPTPAATPTPMVVVYGPTNFPSNVDPLTGLEVSDPSVLDRRPVMVKVANQMAARPHAGLSSADIVFDYYTGEGGDRFIALFYSKDDAKVGTVRSGRLVDIPLAQMYQGILGIMSADNEVKLSDGNTELNLILGSLGGRIINTEHCDENYKAMCNDGPKTETSAFANTSEMTKLYASKSYADNTRQNLDGMSFATIAPAGGVPAAEFTVHYGANNNHQWIYDSASKKYLQWSDFVESNGNTSLIPLVDRNTQQQLAFSNVVVIFAHVDTLNRTDTIHKTTFSNKDGRALIVRDGQVYDVFYKYTWNQPISFYDANGNPFPLQPGNSWFHLVGLNTKVAEQPAGTWMIKIGLP